MDRKTLGTARPTRDLKGRSIRGGVSSLIGELTSFFVRIGSTIILARLLVPEQFGLVGMVTALTGFAQVFKNLGLSDATIQQKDITHEKVSTLFWINAFLGTTIMVVIAGISPAIAWFYGDERLRGITVAMSACFFFSGLNVQHQALLNRRMHFGRLAMVNIGSVFLSSAMGIVMACMGFHYWSLVLKEVLYSFFLTVGSWIMCGWRPGLPRYEKGVNSMLKFGGNITGFNIVSYFSHSTDRMLVGRFAGASVLGLYEKALGLMVLPMSQIRFPMTRVAFSALSALQDDPERYRAYYRKLVELLTFIYMPLVVCLGIYSDEIVRLLLGDRWIGASIFFRILAVASFIHPASSICDVVLMTHGQSRRYLSWGVMNGVTMILAFAVGVQWGGVGVAAAYVVATYGLLWPSLWYRLKYTPVSISLFFRSIYLSVITSLLMGVFVVLVRGYFIFHGKELPLVPACLLSIAVYLGLWGVIPVGKKKLREYYTYKDLVFQKKSDQKPNGS